jgi:HEAT repeat protein
MKWMQRSPALAALLLAAALTLAAAPEASPAAGPQEAAAVAPSDQLESILKELQSYDFAAGVGALTRLRAYVFARKDDPQARLEAEAALLRFVQGSPAPGGLMAACRALSLIGGEASVPVLGALLLEPGTTDAARFALERIACAAADQALFSALDGARGDVRRGIVYSLGERKSPAAVPALAGLAGGKDIALAADAVKALGKIGGPDTVRALAPMLSKAGAPLKSEAASALLLTAEGFLEAGDKAAAGAVYDKVFAAGASAVSRQAAFKGKIAASSDGKTAILKALAGKDRALYAPALAMVPGNFGPDGIGEVAEAAARLSEETRIQLAALLAGYPAGVVRPHLLSAAEDPSLAVRLAALRALAAAGDGKSVVFLAAKAARTTGAEQDAAREALGRLKGKDADAAVLAHLAKASDDAVKAELVQAAGARRIAAAKPALMEMIESGPAALRTKATAALRTIAGPEDVTGLLDLLAGPGDEASRESLQDTIAAVARTSPRELARAGAVKTRLAAEKDPARRADLLRVLGKIGDDSSLGLVRAALAGPEPVVVDAAVRALADWPTVAARDDVLEVARTSSDLNHRVLSVRAFVRMVGLEPNRAPAGATADLLDVLAVSTRPEEKKLVLGMLVRFPCAAGLKAAEALLADPAVAEEARLAADRIRKLK